ncbi:MAG: ATP-dependent zinc metalloprotease FtsH, partial [Planctomycetia bacterium]|nr:ATP-dependent zinc metalloprotease FtsH [Planctomycetia bacterium]
MVPGRTTDTDGTGGTNDGYGKNGGNGTDGKETNGRTGREGASETTSEGIARETTASSLSTSGATASERERRFTTVIPAFVSDQLDRQLAEKLGSKYDVAEPARSDGYLVWAYIGMTFLLLGFMWYMFRRARDSMGGGAMMGFGRSPARRYQAGDSPVTFRDVAGLEGVKAELEEIVEFLKSPEKYHRLGGRIPKGVLLMGPPGTGKTLLARAVAGEAGVPFFSINGSEFIQMFVGVGASRVRDLFATAKENAPCILFIDEIDAVGRHRGTGMGGGNDEREQTLNQILGEMDGFAPSETVIVVAATNRPDVLDPALLRPGRFDRHITVDSPSQKGRLEIFRVHVRNVPLADDVDLNRLAASTVGFTGADIQNLVNEAALWATRQNRDKVHIEDFEYARDKIVMGVRREESLTGKEKTMTAYHESGHTLLAWLLCETERVHKVTVIPRGRALGVTQLLPEEDRLSISEGQLHSRLAFILGGRAAEEVVFDELTAGAENDLRQATSIARRMVCNWGMSKRLGPIAFRESEDHPFLGREMATQRTFSEYTAQLIDEEISKILADAYATAVRILQEHREQLNRLATALEEREELDDREITELIGPPAKLPEHPQWEAATDRSPVAGDHGTSEDVVAGDDADSGTQEGA